MRKLKDGIRSLVKIDFHGNVHKYFRGTDADKRCANEVAVLQELEKRQCPNVPRLLDYNLEENYLKTTNCGSPVPHLSKKKTTSLFALLEERYGVRHDDPESRNITYNPITGNFCIIDFELATLLPMPPSQSSF